MKVLVTGATGFLGSHIVEQLLEQGHGVRALVRGSSNTELLKKLGVETTVASIETGQNLEPAFQDVSAVIHCAGIVKAKTPEEFHRVNALGTQTLLQAAIKTRPNLERFVYISSLAAHGPSPDGEPRDPSAPPNPVTHYGRSKLAGEKIVLENKDKVPVTVVRPPAIYGPRDTEMLAFFKSISRRVMPLMGEGHTASLIYGPDCARAVVATLTRPHPSGSVYFVDDGHIYTWENMGKSLEAALHTKAIPLRIPRRVFATIAFGSELYGLIRDQAVMLTRDKLNELSQQHWVCSSDKIRSELGWSSTMDFGQGASVTADWYRAEGWL